jgi:zinc protease
MELAKKHFGPIAAQKPPPAVTAVEPEQKEFRREELRFPTQLPIVIGGYKIPAAKHEDIAVLDVISFILGGGKSSRMHKSLVRNKKLAVFAGGFSRKMKDPGLFLIFAGFIPMVPSKAVEESLMAEVDQLGEQGPKEEELAKAKTQLAAQYTFKLTSMQSVGFEIGMAELVEGDYKNFLKGSTSYEKITAEDVKRVVNTYLKRDRLTLAVLLPPKSGEKVEKSKASKIEKAEKDTTTWPTAERFLNPEPASSEPVVLPKIARKTLVNGLKLIAIERREQPVVYFDLTVQGGGMLDPKGKAGLADLLAEMLTQGTKTRSAEQIAKEAEGMGGSLHGYAGQEAFSLNGQFLKGDFDKGLALFADVALNPVFPAEEIVKVRPQVEAGVRHTKDSPQALAREHGTYLVYGYNHPRGRPASLNTLKAVEVEDLAAVHKDAFQPQTSILTVVGDLDAQKTLASLEGVFGAWKKTSEGAKLPGDPPKLKGREVRLVDKPDLTQSTIGVGHLGISKLDPDYFPVLLGNYVLGGGSFSSRLMKNIRAKGGKTYGVYSWFWAGKTRGPFGALTFTRNSETGNIIQMVLDEIAKIKKEGVTEKELQAAKNNLAGSYSIRLQTPLGMASELAKAEFLGLGEEWVRNYRKLVTKPSMAEVNQALAKHLDLENMALVVVGKAEEVLDQIKKFGEPNKVDYLSPVPDEEREPEKNKK